MSAPFSRSHELPGYSGVVAVDARPETRSFRVLQEAFPQSEAISRPVIRIINTLIETKHQGRQLQLSQLNKEQRTDLVHNAHVIYLQGLYERSKKSREITIGRRGSFRSLFPGKSDEEIDNHLDGSAFAPVILAPDPRLAAGDNLQQRWEEVARFNDLMRKEHSVKVIGDMIYNHFAIDSSLVRSHPQWFVHVTSRPDWYEEEAFKKDFFRVEADDKKTYFIAHARWTKRGGPYAPEGRDGNVEPWNDLAQLNLANPEVERFITAHAALMGSVFDGARIDAVALLREQVFWDNWEHVLSSQDKDYLRFRMDHPEKALLYQITSAAQQEAGKRGRTFMFTGETFDNFKQRDYLIDTIGQVNLYKWYYDLYDMLYGDKEISIGKFTQNLHNNIQNVNYDHLKNGTMYIEDHDQPPAAHKVGKEKATVAHLLFQTIAQGSYMINFAQQQGYQGEHIDVQVGTSPNFDPDERVQKAFDAGFIIKSSKLLQQAPSENYEILQLPWDGQEWHPKVIPIKITAADRREEAVFLFAPRPELGIAKANIKIPPGATRIEMFDMETGEPVRNIGKVINNTLYVELNPALRQHAQIIRYDLPAVA